MNVRERFLAGVARQLGHPQGLAGRLVGAGLRRGNAKTVSAAVRAAELCPGDTAADVGFGGALGLSLLLDQVGPEGKVHGVEVSAEMLAAARRRFGSELSTGRLTLHTAPMTSLPLADASLNALVTTNTVYFIDDLAPAFAEIARVMTPGRRAVIGIGDPDQMAKMPFVAHGFRIRSIDELTTTAEAAGLTLVDHQHSGDGPRRTHLLAFSRSA
jgi:arsenite methyltransferase